MDSMLGYAQMRIGVFWRELKGGGIQTTKVSISKCDAILWREFRYWTFRSSWIGYRWRKSIPNWRRDGPAVERGNWKFCATTGMMRSRIVIHKKRLLGLEASDEVWGWKTVYIDFSYGKGCLMKCFALAHTWTSMFHRVHDRTGEEWNVDAQILSSTKSNYSGPMHVAFGSRFPLIQTQQPGVTRHVTFQQLAIAAITCVMQLAYTFYLAILHFHSRNVPIEMRYSWLMETPWFRSRLSLTDVANLNMLFQNVWIVIVSTLWNSEEMLIIRYGHRNTWQHCFSVL